MINLPWTLLLNISQADAQGLELVDPSFIPQQKLRGNFAQALQKLIGESTDDLNIRAARARFALARLYAVPDIMDYLYSLDNRVTVLPLRRSVRVVDPVPEFTEWMRSVHPSDILSALPDFGKRYYLFGQTNVESQAGSIFALVLALLRNYEA